MSRRRVGGLERALARPSHGVFAEGELEGLAEPVQRMFRSLIAPGTPLAASAKITMHGRIKLKNWTRFTATEILAPPVGFVWTARAGIISGYDRYLDTKGEMRWKLLGILPLIRADGDDVTRSAAGRLAGEAAWLPTTLLPRLGIDWSAHDDTHLTARHTIDNHQLEIHYELDEQARITTCSGERWGDPDRTGSHALHPFAMEATAHRTFAGLTIPSAGRAGWHYGTKRWEDGIFFEYEISSLDPVQPPAPADPRPAASADLDQRTRD